MTVDEQWLPVVGFEGIYEVSDLGRVRSIGRTKPCRWGGTIPVPARVLKGAPTDYPMVALYKDERRTQARVHHIVMHAFVGPRPDGMQCRHLNGDPSDNRLVNLAWGTAKENSADRAAHGTTARGSVIANSTLTEDIVVQIREMAAAGMGATQIGRALGLGKSAVRHVIKGRHWVHVPDASSESIRYAVQSVLS